MGILMINKKFFKGVLLMLKNSRSSLVSIFVFMFTMSFIVGFFFVGSEVVAESSGVNIGTSLLNNNSNNNEDSDSIKDSANNDHTAKLPINDSDSVKASGKASVDEASIYANIGGIYGFPKSGSAQERVLIWNYLSKEHPDLLQSDITRADSDKEISERDLINRQVRDVRNKLVNIGVDFSDAHMIAVREVRTTVRRSDGVVPGLGVSGYLRMPESVRSELVSVEPHNPMVREGIGYAYIDRYGTPHVATDLASALNYSGNGAVYEYTGRFGAGYALDYQNNRAMINIPGAKLYSNVASKFPELSSEEIMTEKLNPAAGEINPIPLTTEYIEQFTNNAKKSCIFK